MQTARQIETFTGIVENTIPHLDIGWVHTEAGETLFFHRNYVRNRILPKVGQRVKGRIGRVENEEKQARAFQVEVCK